jgi:hypothetical protein
MHFDMALEKRKKKSCLKNMKTNQSSFVFPPRVRFFGPALGATRRGNLGPVLTVYDCNRRYRPWGHLGLSDVHNGRVALRRRVLGALGQLRC